MTYSLVFEENITSRLSFMSRRSNSSRNVIFTVQFDDNTILQVKTNIAVIMNDHSYYNYIKTYFRQLLMH